MEGAPKEVVAEVLGHTTTRMAERYSHLSPGAAVWAMRQTFGAEWVVEEHSHTVSPQLFDLMRYTAIRRKIGETAQIESASEIAVERRSEAFQWCPREDSNLHGL
jgi:hypothetical protein